MSAQMHSNAQILDRRTLEHDHRYLATLLQLGQSVLDVGCGTGAITVGIARAVGSEGFVLGIDRDSVHLDSARKNHALPNLQFEAADILDFSTERKFDITTAARVLQWTSEPELALSRMRDAVKPGGLVVVLDYDHARNGWAPEPPAEFRRTYRAFLDWRAANGWDNEMATHLPDPFRSVDLVDVASHVQDEIVERDSPDFPETSKLWLRTLESCADRLTAGGFLDQDQLHRAREVYRDWIAEGLLRQTLRLSVVVGCVP